MLPARSRLRRSADFRATTRGGWRGGTTTLVAHVRVPVRGDAPGASGARAGFVVSRAVGPAVVRNRVRRRLRHLAAERLAHLPPGASLVVRALPGAARADSVALGTDLDRAVDRAVERALGRPDSRQPTVTTGGATC